MRKDLFYSDIKLILLKFGAFVFVIAKIVEIAAKYVNSRIICEM